MRVVVASPGAGRTMRGYEVFAVQLTESLRSLRFRIGYSVL